MATKNSEVILEVDIFEKETWKFINTFAPWLSAIGTIAAVIVSLYFARRDKKIRLEVTAGHRLIVTPGVPAPHPEYLYINIVNVGHREAQVISIGWKAGVIKKKHAIQHTTNDGLCSSLPVRLKDGEEARYLIPLTDEAQWLKNFARDMILPFPKLYSYFVKVQVFTSVGDKFESRIEKGLRDMLIDVLIKEKKP